MTTDRQNGTRTWADSWWLEIRAYGWLVGVTLPIVLLLGLSGTSLVSLTDGIGVGGGPWYEVVGQMLLWVVWMDGLTAVFAFGAVLVALPFTWSLGRVMRPVRSRAVHVVATSVLAGTLAAVPIAVWPPSAILFVPISVAAGAAGAIARRGEFRRADRLAAEHGRSDGAPGGAWPAPSPVRPTGDGS
ncbi:hypothetical protein DEI81_02210 [Curtobacterium sp. MCBD17_013]|uniref:hypothetical protein n=1 Tax=Curtobacterium sp. MCBD17_013 TaxID=2175668 RepID=UPI000DA73D45|nr:hypothetical protein [Curtobacterium sp. MCBD17_013]PZF66437.1 hypothetical protein DEI81_02210 [Curtobacterium sp. MCBD17_013]